MHWFKMFIWKSSPMVCCVNCIIYTSSLMAPCNHRCPALRFGDVGSALLGLLKKKWNTRWLAENVFLNIFIHSGSIYIGGSEFLLYEFYSRFRGYENTLKMNVSFPIEFLTSMIEHQFDWLNNISTISIKKISDYFHVRSNTNLYFWQMAFSICILVLERKCA